MKITRRIELDWDEWGDAPESFRIKLPKWLKRKPKPKTYTPESTHPYRLVDMSQVITELDPDTSAFTTLLMKVGGDETKAEWLEDKLEPWDWPEVPKCAL